MDTTQVYIAIRSEIVSNHVLMHWFTLTVALAVIVGTVLIERLERTILSVILPLLSLAWAASTLRFDFFIHRQAAYLRFLETQTKNQVPLWDTWKSNLHSTALLVPVADVIATAVIVIPTLYVLYGPAQEYFRERAWSWGRLYAVTVSLILISLLLSLVAVPMIASY